MNLRELMIEVDKLDEEKGWSDKLFALSVLACMLYQQGRKADWELATKHLNFLLGMQDPDPLLEDGA